MNNSEIFQKIPLLTYGTELSENILPSGAPRYRLLNKLYATVTLLNKTGYLIAKKINGLLSVYQIAEWLARQFNVGIDNTLTDTTDLINHLIRHKFVYFLKDTPPLIIETTMMTQPQEVWLNVTSQCNLKCITCFKENSSSENQDMSSEKLHSVIDEVIGLGVGYVVVSGGEPFIRKDILDILQYLKEMNIKILLITNGTLITPEIAKKIGELSPWIVQISLDGSNSMINDAIRGKGVFQKAIGAARLLLAENLDVRLYPTLTRLNIYDIPNMRKLINELRPGYNRLAFAKFHPSGRGKMHAESLYIEEDEFMKIMREIYKEEKLSQPSAIKDFSIAADDMDLTSALPGRTPYGARKINCGLGTAIISIEADGNVYPCQWLHFPDMMAGNLYKQTLKDIYYNSDVFFKCRQLRVDSNIHDCPTCDYKYFCGGGCRARALFNTKAISGKDPHCKYIYPNFHHGLWAENMFEGEPQE